MGRSPGAWGLAGMAAALLAVGVGELVGGILAGASIIAAIGTLVIELQPPGAKDLMVDLFGDSDKLALEVMVVIGGLALGAVLGAVARWNMRYAQGGIAAAAVAAILLLARDPLIGLTGAALTVVPAGLAGGAALGWLGGMLARPAAAAASTEASPPTVAPALARRSFLAVTAIVLAVGGVLALIGRFVSSQLPTTSAPIAIPPPGETLPPLPAGAELGIDGLTPIVVPNDYPFYRIDTRLTVPRLSAETWSVRIHGMVDREVVLSYADLIAMPLVERYVTIACVSNNVGGNLVGNARWTGVSLASVLSRAGVQPAATQLVGRSFDGWTCGFPTAHLAGAGSEAMIALQMNGVPLPAEHGYPARLIVPGLYGYVSATKWLTELELTTLEAFDAYWVPLGWAKEAPILTQSRIDVPRPGGRVTAGRVQVAGVAWAPTRGISRVEVQLDGDAWHDAALSVALSDAAWVQWAVTLDVPAGPHTVSVRATDGTGETQTEERTRPAPDGARGYHQIEIAAV